MRFRDVGKIVRPEPVIDEFAVGLFVADDNRACVGFDDFTFHIEVLDSNPIAISQFQHVPSIRGAMIVC